jgi:hypothetical protein
MVVWCVQIKRLTVGVLWPLFKVAAAATTVGRAITCIIGVIARRR